MNIQTVIANLLNTIEGKEAYLASLNKRRIVDKVLIEILEINLKELNAILADCMKVREADIVADLERKDTERKAAEASWITNPDCSGGQFTQDEIDNAGRWN